jgi:hypothetical protein
LMSATGPSIRAVLVLTFYRNWWLACAILAEDMQRPASSSRAPEIGTATGPGLAVLRHRRWRRPSRAVARVRLAGWTHARLTVADRSELLGMWRASSIPDQFVPARGRYLRDGQKSEPRLRRIANNRTRGVSRIPDEHGFRGRRDLNAVAVP